MTAIPFARTLIAALVSVTSLGLVAAPSAFAADSRELLITFRGVSGTVTDGTTIATAGSASTIAVLRTHARGGARAAVGPNGGHAIRLPAFDADADATRSTVPLAVLSVTGSALDPGWRPFEFGASFKLNASGNNNVDNGENLVQRGRYAAASQYKLQVDKGRPTCRVMGSKGAVMVAGAKVVRNEWYDMSCRRTWGGVRLELTRHFGDGSTATRAWTASGSTGSLSGLAASTPLTVGGKLTTAGQPMARDADQFNGVVDTVFVDIEN